ncbi:hypothetical protein E2P81_ATG11505 [Venturia nashicola]|nr:hypothetical protein E2P81_ATG11505 [Venturia nashicola]
MKYDRTSTFTGLQKPHSLQLTFCNLTHHLHSVQSPWPISQANTFSNLAQNLTNITSTHISCNHDLSKVSDFYTDKFASPEQRLAFCTSPDTHSFVDD